MVGPTLVFFYGIGGRWAMVEFDCEIQIWFLKYFRSWDSLLSVGLSGKMIKRRFYKIDHGDRDVASDASSSSSDSEVEAEEAEESEDDAIPEVNQDDASTSSGYKSEDSSANDVDVNSSGQLFSEDDDETGNEREMLLDRSFSIKHDSQVSERRSKVMAEKESSPAHLPSYVLKSKSVFKCRICPRVICLTEDTLRAHLNSKRHARSEKLLNEGRLKAMLNSYGEIEEQEVSEMHSKSTEENPEKENRGPKQNKKRRKKRRNDANTEKMPSKKDRAKRWRKNEK
ncbi:hypothetical protein L6164_007803 [Bauhinia variegata]|uniref:Uncharacterized protein n=1 Tax=Bauhinia variegata TaxID=167791 RepID=A0ACB9PK56_BAUVA|nr:hypothetical protein L6164_007803 [Bauhinia variegata]